MSEHPAIWRIGRGGQKALVMGSAPPGRHPWHSDTISDCLAECRVLWTEIPPAGPDGQALAIQHGVDPARPLASRISKDLLFRVEAAAHALSVAPGLIGIVRPWLAAQILQMADSAAAGIDPEFGPDAVLTAEGRRSGLETRHEFPDFPSTISWFTGLSVEAEAEYLAMILNGIEAGQAAAEARLEEWRRGDLTLAERESVQANRHRRFYDEMVVSRNHGWLQRFDEALRSGVQHFFLIGTGHLVGPRNTLELATRAGFDIVRV